MAKSGMLRDSDAAVSAVAVRKTCNTLLLQVFRSSAQRSGCSETGCTCAAGTAQPKADDKYSSLGCNKTSLAVFSVFARNEISVHIEILIAITSFSQASF